jgi:hypothetical protein
MKKAKSYEGLEVVEPRTTQYGSRKGEPMCQSRNQSGYWKGQPCGNAAKHRLFYPSHGDEDGNIVPSRTVEVCCSVHIVQAITRNPNASLEALNWQPTTSGDEL